MTLSNNLKTKKMKPSKYIIETNILKAEISRGIKTKFDWFLEINTQCGGKLIGSYRQIFLTKKNALKEFQDFRKKGFLIKEL